MRKRNKHVGLFLEEFLKPRVGGGPWNMKRVQNTALKGTRSKSFRTVRFHPQKRWGIKGGILSAARYKSLGINPCDCLGGNPVGIKSIDCPSFLKRSTIRFVP